jgi:rfaE bifunctional protein kinase chain/domain
MITKALVDRTLSRLPSLHVGVVGDLFLDRYLDLDARLTEPSVETGLEAYQVVRVRSYPGAAGTILNNLVDLGVARVSILSVIGDDGEGYELRRELDRRKIDQRFLLVSPERFTPTYTKPMLHPPGVADKNVCPTELNRLDIKNRTPLPAELDRQVLESLPRLFAEVDALLVLDQVSEPECGVITSSVRERLAELGSAHPLKFILADSRERIGRFRNVSLKPNRRECQAAIPEYSKLADCVRELARKAGRAVFCTRGDKGILLADPTDPGVSMIDAPATPVTGPIDSVGAGDATSAGIACAVAAGASLVDAAAFGNLIASITIQQIGATGTATPAQVRQRWSEVGSESERVNV